MYFYIHEKYDWKYISHILQSIKFLITKLENDETSIADIYVNLDFTLNEKSFISVPKTRRNKSWEEPKLFKGGRPSESISIGERILGANIKVPIR